MRIVVLGAGTAIPASGYSPSGIYVQVAKEHILLDAGSGTLQRLQKAGLPWHRIDRIFLTHFHLDHCLDLASILFAYRLPQLARKKPLAVYGPAGLKRLYTRLNTAFQGWMSPRGFKLTITEIGEANLRMGGYTVGTRRMNHYKTRAVGYRITHAGKSLAYSGDTALCRGILELGYQTDLLMLECAVTDEKKMEGHLSPSLCGQIAAKTDCNHLLLTHFYPVFEGYDIRKRLRRFYRGRVTLAKDFTSLIL